MSQRCQFRSSTVSLDHLVGEREQPVWNCEAERLSRLKINDQFEFRGLLDRQVTRLLVFENPANVDANPTVHVRQASERLARNFW